jgi:hypothetical protein
MTTIAHVTTQVTPKGVLMHAVGLRGGTGRSGLSLVEPMRFGDVDVLVQVIPVGGVRTDLPGAR